MIDAVLSFHTNPYTCGVAKFSLRLARELGVPLYGLQDPVALKATYPLISLKFTEARPSKGTAIPRWSGWNRYDLFLHDEPSQLTVGGRYVYQNEWLLIEKATRVYAANRTIARIVQSRRADVVEAWCPSLIEPPRPRADRTVLTFGMAHKYVPKGGSSVGSMLATQRTQPLAPHFERLRDLLDADGQPYTILLSSAVHEGTPWDATLEESTTEMRRIFGDRLEVLGFLSDAALARELAACSAVALFYDPAVRANNTTFWAALEHTRLGTPILTTVDDDSPVHAWCPSAQMGPIYDIRTLTHWPTERTAVEGFVASRLHEWGNLLATLQDVSCVN